MSMKKLFVCFIAALLFNYSSDARLRPYIQGGVGFYHLYAPSDNYATQSSPLYFAGLGLLTNHFGMELNCFTTKYTSAENTYRYLNPDFYYTYEKYKRVFTRNGLNFTLNYHYSFKPKITLWVLGGVSYYQFDYKIQTSDKSVGEEIKSFDKYWKKYDMIIPVGSLRLSYTPFSFLNIYVEGGYDVSMFKTGLIFGNIIKKHSKNRNDSTQQMYNSAIIMH